MLVWYTYILRVSILQAVLIIFNFHALYTISFPASLYSERTIFPCDLPSTQPPKEYEIRPRLP